MNGCSHLYLLSTLACQMASCLSDEELAVLSADLVVLGDLMANILARNALCQATQEDTTNEPATNR